MSPEELQIMRLEIDVYQALAERAGAQILRCRHPSGSFGFTPSYDSQNQSGLDWLWFPPIRGLPSYLIAMHEFGHYFLQQSLQTSQIRILQEEAEAWLWAFERCLIPMNQVKNKLRKLGPTWGFWSYWELHTQKKRALKSPEIRECTEIWGLV